MQPLFQPPVTPNNGNPNTVYNRKPGGMEKPRTADPFAFNQFEVLPDDTIGPVFSPTFVTEETIPATKPVERYVAPVQGREVIGEASPITTPMPKPVVTPAFNQEPIARPKPVVTSPVVDSPAGPPLTGPSVGGEYLRYAEQNQPVVQDKRTTMGQWLPRFAIDTSTLGTQFGPGAPAPAMDYWRSRLQQIMQGAQPVAGGTLPQLPTRPQDPTTPGTGGGGTTPPNPTGPASPIFGTTTPDENGIIRGPDPIDYGRVGGGSVGRLLGLSGSLGLSGPQISSAYNNLTPEQQRRIDEDSEKLNSPTTPEDEKPGILARIRQALGAVLGSVRDFGRAVDEFGERIDSRINNSLDQAINWLTDDPSRFRDVSGLTGNVGPIQNSKGPAAGGNTGGTYGGRGKPTDPSSQKPGSRIPRRPS